MNIPRSCWLLIVDWYLLTCWPTISDDDDDDDDDDDGDDDARSCCYYCCCCCCCCCYCDNDNRLPIISDEYTHDAYDESIPLNEFNSLSRIYEWKLSCSYCSYCLLYVVDPIVHTTVVGSVFLFVLMAVLLWRLTYRNSSRKRTQALSMMTMIWEDKDLIIIAFHWFCCYCCYCYCGQSFPVKSREIPPPAPPPPPLLLLFLFLFFFFRPWYGTCWCYYYWYKFELHIFWI